MTTDPRIRAVMDAQWWGKVEKIPEGHRSVNEGIVRDILAAADAVDPLRNPTEADIERAAKQLFREVLQLSEEKANRRWKLSYEYERDEYRMNVRAVVVALRGGEA